MFDKLKGFIHSALDGVKMCKGGYQSVKKENSPQNPPQPPKQSNDCDHEYVTVEEAHDVYITKSGKYFDPLSKACPPPYRRKAKRKICIKCKHKIDEITKGRRILRERRKEEARKSNLANKLWNEN